MTPSRFDKQYLNAAIFSYQARESRIARTAPAGETGARVTNWGFMGSLGVSDELMTFQELYETYFPDVFRFALWLTRNRTEADDVAAETFVRAWARRDRFRTETLKAYLLAIARNIYLTQRRHAGRSEELFDEIPDTAPDPQRQATARLDLERVSNSLARMPEIDRHALFLRSEHALPYAEIARVLEVSEGAARIRVYRARRKLLEDSNTNNGGNHGTHS